MANQLIISLAGVNADPEARENLIFLMQGGTFWEPDAEPKLWLQPEPDNPVDKAAMVCLVNGRKIGYIPRKFAGTARAFLTDCDYGETAAFHIHEWGRLSNGEGIFCVIRVND